MALALSVVLTLFSCLIPDSHAESSLDSLNQLQKQSVGSQKEAGGSAIDLLVLDILQGKFQRNGANPPAWVISRYPTASEIAGGIAPRVEVKSEASGVQNALVPIKLVRGLRGVGESTCKPAEEPRVSADQKCTELNGVLSCVSGKMQASAAECTPSSGRATSQFTLDSSNMGSLETGVPEDEEQMGYVGVPNLGLILNDLEEQKNLFSNPASRPSEKMVGSRRVVFRSYVPHPNFSALVSGLEVQAGNTLAILPIAPPTAPSCKIKVPTSFRAADGSLEVVLEASGTLTDASVNGISFPIDPNQSSDEPLRVIGKHSFIIDTKELKDVVQKKDSDYATGTFLVEGQVFGPLALNPAECSENVMVEFYRPQAPECAISLNPDTQEPDEPVQVTVEAKNPVTSATLNGSVGISFSPTPSVSTVGVYSTTLRKNGESQETLSAEVTGPGGTTKCTKQLFIKTPLPPTCILSASPTELQIGQSTTLTLKATNRVDSANIAGSSVTLSSVRDGVGTMTYKKNNADPELIEAVVSSRGMSSTCSVNLGCATSAGPRCSLSVAPTTVKPGEEALVTLSCQDPVASASIAGFPVQLSGGSTSMKYKKSGLSSEIIEAVVRGEGQCGSESRSQARLEANPPCRFANSEYSEILKVPVWLWNTQYNIFNLASFQRVTQKTTKQCVSTRTPRCQSITSNVTETVSCGCGQKVVSDTSGKQVCQKGADKLTSKPLPADEAEAYLEKNPGTCKLIDPFSSDDNEKKFAANTYWNVNFQHKVKRIRERIDKIQRIKTTTTFSVPSNLDWFDPGSVAPTENRVSFTADRPCSTECSTLSNGDLCLSKTIEGALRTKGTGKNQSTYLDNAAICESEQLIGEKITPQSGVSIRATPGYYYKYINATKGEFIHSDLRVSKACADNHLCVVEITDTDVAKHSDTYFWLEVGPVDDSQCKVTRIDTSISVRNGGCFTAATPVKMANGEEKLVSEIRENDYVFNPHYGTGVRVRKVVKGPEKKALYEVVLGDHRVEVTEDHPFFTQRGWLQTMDLKNGDQLLGEGPGKVINRVRKLLYRKPVDVWNFELDTEDPLAHVVMANGIPTGDLVTQLEIKKNKKQLP